MELLVGVASWVRVSCALTVAGAGAKKRLMKRMVFSGLAVLVGFVIVAVSAVSVGRSRVVGKVGAQQEASESAVVETDAVEAMSEGQADSGDSTDSTGSLQAAGVEYYLPYPGILPDHPLYFLKMIRDRVRLFTVSKEEKAELLLLLADKRIGASLALVEGGKVALGLETAVKAEGYLEQVAGEVENGSDREFLEVLNRAVRKHGEVLGKIGSMVSGEAASQLEQVVKQNQAVLQRLPLVVEEQVEGVIQEEGVEIDPEVEPVEIGL